MGKGWRRGMGLRGERKGVGGKERWKEGSRMRKRTAKDRVDRGRQGEEGERLRREREREMDRPRNANEGNHKSGERGVVSGEGKEGRKWIERGKREELRGIKRVGVGREVTEDLGTRGQVEELFFCLFIYLFIIKHGRAIAK